MRSKYLFLGLIFILISFNNFAQQQQQIPWLTLMDSPWPMVKHDPQGTGRSPHKGPKTPNVIWTKDLEYGVFSGPVIDLDGNLYVGTSTWLPYDTTNYFYSIYPDGTNRWTFYTGETYSTSSGFLIGSDSTIYFGSHGGYVYAINFDGKLKWKHDYGMSIFSHLMNIDKDSSIYVASADGFLYSIYKHNGAVRWKVSYDGDFRASSPVFSPDGGTIYIAGHDSNLYALNLDGSLKWRFSCGTTSVIPTVDNEGNIYITTQTDSFGLHSLYPNGELRWVYYFDNYNLNRNTYCPSIDKNGNIYFPAIYLYGQLIIISVDYDGNFRWEYQFEQQDEDITVYWFSGKWNFGLIK
jgi:outer membrane protein assembly factor BamB